MMVGVAKKPKLAVEEVEVQNYCYLDLKHFPNLLVLVLLNPDLVQGAEEGSYWLEEREVGEGEQRRFL